MIKRWSTLLLGLALGLVFSGAALVSPTAGQSQWRNYSNITNVKAIAAATGSVWAATEEGVTRWSQADGSFVNYTTADGLASDHVRAIAIDRQGNIWFGTFDRGVSRLAADGQSWTTYTTADGLVDNKIEAITVDGRGHVWIATRGGVSEFVPPGSTTASGEPAGPAAEENRPPACDYSFPAQTDFGLAAVTGQEERLYFYSGSQGCPEGQSCRREAYVLPGDTLIISSHYRNWVCAWYEPAEGAPTIGWVRTGGLAIQPVAANPPEMAWLGTWQDGPGRTLTIRQNEPGALAASGQAYWQGSAAGAVNSGQFSGQAWIRRNHLTVVDDNFSPCIVSMDLVGSYLIVRDTHQCGGMNVVFDGIYQKRDQP